MRVHLGLVCNRRAKIIIILIHREIQVVVVVREQVRQFALAKQDMDRSMASLSAQLGGVLRANEELRRENERLRHIY